MSNTERFVLTGETQSESAQTDDWDGEWVDVFQTEHKTLPAAKSKARRAMLTDDTILAFSISREEYGNHYGEGISSWIITDYWRNAVLIDQKLEGWEHSI